MNPLKWNGWKKYAFYGAVGYGAYHYGRRIYKRCTRKSFDGDIVLITGGAQGLGKCLAKNFLEEGCTVVIWDINEETGKKTLKEFSDDYGDGRVFFYRVNIADCKMVQEYAVKTREEVGDVDVLVNNAGIVAKQEIYDQSIESMKRVVEVNTFAHFYTVKAFLPSMVEKNKGHIVTVGSVASMGGCAGMASYCASKCAVLGFSESIRLQFIKDNLDIDGLLVMPYYMKGPMFKGVNTGLIPILDPEYVADRTIIAMKERDAELVIPGYLRHINYQTRSLIWRWAAEVQRHLGILDSMNDVVQKKKKK